MQLWARYLKMSGLPWFDSNRIAWGEFKRLWTPKGNGLICWNPSR